MTRRPPAHSAPATMTLCSHRRKLCCLFYLVTSVSVTCLVSALFLLSNLPEFRSTDVTLFGGTRNPPKRHLRGTLVRDTLPIFPTVASTTSVLHSKTRSSLLVSSIERFLYHPHGLGTISSAIIDSMTS